MTTSSTKGFRICMAAGHFLPQIGGVERYIYNLSAALVEQGAEVAVVAAQPKGEALHETIDGIEVFRLPSLLLAGGRLPMPAPFSGALQKQYAAIRAWKPDIMVVHTHLFASNLAMARLAGELGIPCVLINHGSGYVAGGNPVVDAVLKLYERYLAAQIGRRAVAAFGVSRSAAHWLSEFGIETSEVMANGVNVSALPGRSSAFREKIGVAPESCLVAYAARLLIEKGADTLITAFRKLAPSDATLVIAGDGPAMAQLKTLAAGDSRIRFLGACAHPDVLALFGAADIMAYPSRYPEGQPTTVLEAGAMGCAVIATPRGGTAELIDTPEVGLIVQDAAEFETALARLLADADLRQSMGRKLRDKVHNEHDWRVIARRALERLQELRAGQQDQIREETA